MRAWLNTKAGRLTLDVAAWALLFAIVFFGAKWAIGSTP